MKTGIEINEDLAYLFSKINFAASFLDAKAITIMNSITFDIKESCIDEENSEIVLDGIGTQGENCSFLNIYQGDNKKGFIDISDTFEVDKKYTLKIRISK